MKVLFPLVLFSWALMPQGVVADRSCNDCLEFKSDKHPNSKSCKDECERQQIGTRKECKKICKPKNDKFLACLRGKQCGLEDIRFNKFPSTDESVSHRIRAYVNPVHPELYPFTKDHYPQVERSTKTVMLKEHTMADSVVTSEDFQLYGFFEPSYWMEDPVTGAKLTPIFPEDEGFWTELEKVVRIAIAREEGQMADGFYGWPETWKKRNLVKLSPWLDDEPSDEALSLKHVASAVDGEYPVYHQQMFIKKLFAEGVKLDMDLGQPFRSDIDFIGKPVKMATINTWTFEAVAPVNFMLKWHFGMPRPEEMVWRIHRGDIGSGRNGVPKDLVNLIQGMDIENAHQFTAYKSTGSPFHPSYPAMHSAGSTCSLWLAALCKLSPKQYLEALRVDYAVAMGRTVAGVHYDQDNIAGLNIGQRIIREKLPEYLNKMYDYDEDKISERLINLSFDWADFDPVEGKIGDKTAADFLADAMGSDYSMYV